MEPLREHKWILPDHAALPSEDEILRLSREIGSSRVFAELLALRGYRTKEEVERFLSLEDTLLHSPFLMPDIAAATRRICRAIAEKEKIAIYGDYDVDGVSSVCLTYLYLSERGADVGYYIPNRNRDGYGVSEGAIRHLAEEGVTLIVTVDTGITAFDEIALAGELGMDVVVTDHHVCREKLPAAVAVVNPLRADSAYPFAELAGVGVAFKVMCAVEATLAAKEGESEIDAVRRMAYRFADLVTIGTIADVMPITDENRLIVSLGLRAIEKKPRTGLAALIAEASGNGENGKRRKITSSFVGFTLAPRLNAAGRMCEASLSVELLLSRETEEAQRAAARLSEINRERQAEENRIAEEVYRRIREEYDLKNTHVLVLEGNTWKQGVVGIVASRVTERLGIPCILVSFDGADAESDDAQDVGRGSGRSVAGFDLVGALAAVSAHLVRYGGHELAAGLSIRRGDVAAFREALDAYAAQKLSPESTAVSMRADMLLSPREVSLLLAEELTRLEPYGVGNPAPVFCLCDLTVARIQELGGGKHLKLELSDGEMSLSAMLFSTSRAVFGFEEGDVIDILAGVDVNEFRGTRSVQLVVRDVRAARREQEKIETMRARYAEIKNGAPFEEAEAVIPDREDLKAVYVYLCGELAAGRDMCGDAAAYRAICKTHRLSFCAFMAALSIFDELRIFTVSEVEEGIFRFARTDRKERADIETSSFLRRLRAQKRNT